MDVTGQMPNYDLYTELALDKDMPPAEIGQLLDDRISTLTGQGYQQNSPEVDQLATARAILSDPAKRDTYEAALAGPDGVVDVSWLHNLADAPSRATSAAPASPVTPEGGASHRAPEDAASPSSGPSYDAASTSVIDARSAGTGADSGARDEDSGSASGAAGADLTAAPFLSSGPVAGPAASSVSSVSSVSSASPTEQGSGPSGFPYGGAQGAQYGSLGAPQYGAQPSFGQSGSAGDTGTGFNSGSTGFSSGNFGAPAASSPVKQQFTAASLSVAGRSRSQSKVYLACLAVIVVGMLYPLVILFTAGKDDVDAVYSILKATMFTLAHTAAWLAIAEIVWGVRRIVAPEQTPVDATSATAPAEK